MANMDQKPKPKTPLKFGQPEKRDYRKIALFALFVIIGVGAIIWMAMSAPRQKQLICHSTGQNSLIGFGTCTTEE